MNYYMGGTPKNKGVFPPKWMVKIVENPINPWMIWGDFTHYFRKHPYFRLHLRGMAFLFALKSCKPIKLSNDLEI